MSLEKDVMTQMKVAMKAKDSETLEALRAVKGAIILAKTDNGQQEITEEQEVKLVQKLVKQRKDSAQLYREQNREDLAEPEEKQAEVISQFLPEQLSEAEIEAKVVADAPFNNNKGINAFFTLFLLLSVIPNQNIPIIPAPRIAVISFTPENEAAITNAPRIPS